MKKIIIVFMAVMLTVFSLVSCRGKPEDADVLSAFTELYNKSIAVNEYVFGKGLPYDNPESYDIENLDSPYYVAVSESSPYKSIAELEAAILEVYSKAYYEGSLKQGLFDGYENDDKNKPRYVEEKGVLKIDITKPNLITVPGTFDTASAKVKSASFSEAVIKATWTSGATSKEYELVMVYDGSAWRMDTPTY